MKQVKSHQEFNVRLFSRRRRFFLIGIGAVLLSVCMAVFAILPLVQANIAQFQKVAQERTRLQSLQRKVIGLDELGYLQESANLKNVEAALPSEKPLLQLLASTNAVASEAGVAISDIDTSPGRLATQSGVASGSATTIAAPVVQRPQRLASGVDILVIELKVKGTLAQIRTFLRLVEQQTPLTDVTEIQLSNVEAAGAAENAQTDSFEARVTLTTYYFTQAITVSVEKELPEIGQAEQTFLESLANFRYVEFQKAPQIQGGGLQDLFGVKNDVKSDVENP